MAKHKPIIVTGAHRSGTTWVGQMIAMSRKVRYIHEPFNIDEPRIHPLKYWFEYVNKNSPKEKKENIYRYIDEILDFNLRGIAKDLRIIRGPRDILRFTKDSVERINKRPLLKAPIAVMSTDWLANNFDADVVVLIRHPAAFVASLKVKQWDHMFEHFIAQPDLMKVLSPFADKIYEYDKNPPDIIDQGSLLWNVIYYRVSQYKKKYPEWQFITHEAISLDPLNQYKAIYEKLNLKFTKRIEEEIIKSTSSKTVGRLVRNSKKNITTWKKRLTKDEIERIKRDTLELANEFYGSDAW